MTRITLSALLGLVLAGAAPAADPGTADDLARELKALREEVAALRRTVERESRLNNAEMELLTKRVERIEKSIKELSGRSGPYRSEFTPSAPRTALGTIKLDNRLPVAAQVVLDGVTYSVPALGTRTISGRRTGTVSYQVTADGYGWGPLTRTTLASGETLTLTIN
jgi:hypothetical protein